MEELSADIGRHLSGHAVLARRPTVPYRVGKFIRRHKLGALAAMLVFFSLVGGIVSTVREARIARAERARAERRFNDVRMLAHSMLFEVHDAIEKLPGSTAARELLIQRALEYLDGLAGEASGDPSLQAELAAAYERIGDVQGRVFDANLGKGAAARESHAKALAMREALVAAQPKNVQYRRDLAASYFKRGEDLFSTGDPKLAAGLLAKAVAIHHELLAEDPSSTKEKDLLGRFSALYGYILGAGGDLKGGLENVRRAIDLLREVEQASPSTSRSRGESPSRTSTSPAS